MSRCFKFFRTFSALLLIASIATCADIPDKMEVDVPKPEMPSDKFQSVNRHKEPVIYVKIGEDVLKPRRKADRELPKKKVGPYELRSETLASALQFLLDDFDIPIALETEEALSRKVTISKLKGDLNKVVEKVCSLADLYCSYEDEVLTVKEEETFAIPLPPLGDDANESFLAGLDAITGGSGVIDTTTQTIIYTATNRTQRRVRDYFERIRNNTALIIYEMQIWEVNLSNEHDLGIDWSTFEIEMPLVNRPETINLSRAGTPAIESAVSAAVQYVSGDLTFDGVVQFLETQGAVKTISQPQLTVLSGSEATLRIGNTRDYISEVTSTEGFDADDDISIETATLETGLDITISSAWNESTVYGSLTIELDDLIDLDERSVGSTTIQLPETSERVLETRVRVRPGDAMIIAGIVQERDDVATSGPSFISRIFPTSKATEATNSELVFMMRPRVVVFTDTLPGDKRLLDTDVGAAYATSENLIEVNTPPAVIDPKPVVKPSPLSQSDVNELNEQRGGQEDGSGGETVAPRPSGRQPMSRYLDQLLGKDIAP